MQEIIIQNLLSPAVLFFLLGIMAALVKSDLKFPSALTETLSIYLLVAIGLKGGIALSEYSWQSVATPIIGTLILGIITPLIAFMLCRWVSIDQKNAAAIAATYGSVSIVTYGAAAAFLDQALVSYEGYMGAMVVLLESPAIIVSFLLLAWLQSKESVQEKKRDYALGIISNHPNTNKHGLTSHILKESFFGKSVLLMLGALSVGLIVGQEALPVVKPLFIDLYPSLLMIFLLGMGLVAGERLTEIKQNGLKLILLALAMPIMFGFLGTGIGYLFGLSVGGTALMGVLGASASYIAAPAAIKQSIPEANPSMHLGMALGITFPFNLIVGIPLFLQVAHWLH
jgi:hypothetical protein